MTDRAVTVQVTRGVVGKYSMAQYSFTNKYFIDIIHSFGEKIGGLLSFKNRQYFLLVNR